MNTTGLCGNTRKRQLKSLLTPVPGMVLSTRLITRLAPAIALALLAACVSTQQLEAGENLVSDTPIGQEREAVMAQPADLSAADAECETVKTGVGVNRRAYFLETCTWQSPAVFSVCGSAPEIIAYTFLEGRMLAATFSFAKGDLQKVQACISEQALANGYLVDSAELADGQVAKMSNAASKTAISMTDEDLVRIFDAELAPRVHLLRDKL